MSEEKEEETLPTSRLEQGLLNDALREGRFVPTTGLRRRRDDEGSDSDDDEMDSRLESSVHSEEKEKERVGSASDWEEKDGVPYSVSDLFNIADAVNLYATSLVSRGF